MATDSRMEVSDISIFVSTKRHILKIKVNFNSLKEKYKGKRLLFKRHIGDHKTSAFLPSIVIKDKNLKKGIYVTLKNSKNLVCDFDDFVITESNGLEWRVPHICGTSCSCVPSKSKSGRRFTGFDLEKTKPGRKIVSIRGWITLTFEADENIDLRDRIESDFSILKMPKQPEDFRIICEDQEVSFNRNFLTRISDVFQAMLESPYTLEFQRSFVKMENVSLETVQNFKRILCDGVMDKEVLNVDMLMFADRYNVQPLVKLCKNEVMINVTKNNVIDVIRASEALNDENLLKAAVDFLSIHMGTLEDDPEWEQLMISNPSYFTKIWKLLMFKKQS